MRLVSATPGNVGISWVHKTCVRMCRLVAVCVCVIVCVSAGVCICICWFARVCLCPCMNVCCSMILCPLQAMAVVGCRRAALALCGVLLLQHMHHASAYSDCFPVSYARHANQYTIATSVFGGVSLLVCCSVVVVVVAHRKDTMYLRERIVLGLMGSNIVFSIANMVPVYYFVDECTLLFSVDSAAWTRGIWILGKYWMVCYELMIVGTSLYALRTGRSTMPRVAERMCHVLCVSVGLVAMTTWLIQAVPLAQKMDLFSHAQQRCDASTDDYDVYNNCVDAAGFSNAAAASFNAKKTSTLSWMIRLWLLPFLLSMALWVVSRVQYYRLLRAWQRDCQTAMEVWDRDHWAVTDNGVRHQQKRLLELRREAFDAIARPLEPYVAVFGVFAIPAIVITTDYCQRKSAALASKDEFCQLPCEMVLAMRSGATAAVYFWDDDNRSQLLDVRHLLTRLWRRLCTCSAHRNHHSLASARAEHTRLQELQRAPDEAPDGAQTTHASILVERGGKKRRKARAVGFANELDIRLIDNENVEDAADDAICTVEG
eukprot:m.1407493 g.1407493  ORF g.1407493 m.1407493 type:complete len:543 (+) comp25020_c0_seq1:1168-2796(+)